MKKDQENTSKTPQNEGFNEILYLYYVLKAQKVVKTQKNFADILHLSEQTVSNALNEKERYVTDKILERVRKVAKEYNVTFSGNTGTIASITSEGGEQKNLGNESQTAALLVQELAAQREQYGKQIERLLSIIEKITK